MLKYSVIKDGAYISGDAYYRFTSHLQKKPDEGYPKSLTSWDMRWLYMDAAFQYKDRKTYFFQGRGYYVFDDNSLSVSQSWILLKRRVNMHDVLILNVRFL